MPKVLLARFHNESLPSLRGRPCWVGGGTLAEGDSGERELDCGDGSDMTIDVEKVHDG